MKRLLCFLILLLTVIIGFAQSDRKQSFDSHGKILVIHDNSRFAPVWTPTVGGFYKIEAFLKPDSTLVLDVYTDPGQRYFLLVSPSVFKTNRQLIDSLLTISPSESELVETEDRSDLEFDFIIGQVSFVGYHSVAVPNGVFRMNSVAAPLLITGGSYFLLSHLIKDEPLNRSIVAGTFDGHLAGLGQGLFAGFALNPDNERLILGATSAGGILHAVSSFKTFKAAKESASVSYLRLKAETYSLFWPALILNPLWPDSKRGAQSAAATGLALSLTSRFWSPSILKYNERNMSLGDAMLVEDFHLNVVSTVFSFGAASQSFEEKWFLPALGVSSAIGLMMGTTDNDNQGYTYNDARLIKRYIYGGGLVGLGFAAAVSADKWTPSLATAGLWTGYMVGKRMVSRSASTSQLMWDVQIMPENWLLASRFKQPESEPPVSLPIARLTWYL